MPASCEIAPASSRFMSTAEKKVVFAASLGTVFEWYDFFVYGTLAAVIGKQFFSGVNETTAFILALLSFAAGFVVRPFGAVFFGRFGDVMGRKKTFLATMLTMGLATFAVGCLPSYASIGLAAPLMLVVLRMLQGLALGGEYGGAATYVAEHAPHGQRGYFTSWIQTTATAGLIMSLLVIMSVKAMMSAEAFDAWGWRVPFLLSAIMLAGSMWVRVRLDESPIFTRMKEEGKSSRSPLKDAFANKVNLKVVAASLLGGTAGQAVVWYTGQFYALYFITQTLKLPSSDANLLMTASLLLGTPFFVVFGTLSDRIGRKRIVLTGMMLAALSYFPLFAALGKAVNPALMAAAEAHPVTIVAKADTCSFQFDPIGVTQFTSPCDVAKTTLARKGLPYTNVESQDAAVTIKVGTQAVASYDAADPQREEQARDFSKKLDAALEEAGYPRSADPANVHWWTAAALLTCLVMLVTMVYGPMAAWLVELFPAKIRYSSMSLPYHIGNGWFGGFLPTVSFAMVAATGDIFYGLWYPIVVAGTSAVIGYVVLPETKNREIHHEA